MTNIETMLFNSKYKLISISDGYVLVRRLDSSSMEISEEKIFEVLESGIERLSYQEWLDYKEEYKETNE